MAKQKLEIECPVCDAKLSIDARSCPRCGADLGMADFQDLENLANDISEGKEYSEQTPGRAVPRETEAESEAIAEEVAVPIKEEPKPEVTEIKMESKPKVEASPPKVLQKDEPKKEEVVEEEGEEVLQDDKGKKKGLFSKFFGKKK
jgi:hypothetical protein